MLILIWGIDILFEKLTPEIGGWIWKAPFEHYASEGEGVVEILCKACLLL